MVAPSGDIASCDGSIPWSLVGLAGSNVSHLPGSLPRAPSVETHPGRTLSDPSAARAISTMPATETPRAVEITYAKRPFGVTARL